MKPRCWGGSGAIFFARRIEAGFTFSRHPARSFRLRGIGQVFGISRGRRPSVLTEEDFFHGSLKNLREARKNVSIPVFRKDFIFDPWQIWESRANDSDSFLLIVAALGDIQLSELISLGRELGMERSSKSIHVKNWIAPWLRAPASSA